MKKTLCFVLAVIMMFSVFSVTTFAADDQPTEITEVAVTSAKVSGDGILVKWSKVPGAVSYIVYRYDSTTNENEAIQLVNTASNEYLDKKDIQFTCAKTFKDGDEPAVSYYYAVAAVMSDTIIEPVFGGEKAACQAYCECKKLNTVSKPSSVYEQGYTYQECPVCGYRSETKYTDQIAPKTPRITALKNTANGIYLKWNIVDGANTYFLYRKVGNGGWKLYDILSRKYAYTDRAVKTGTSYRYTVRAANIPAANTAYTSNPVTGKTSVNLQWPVTANCNTYYVVRYDSKNNQTYIGQVSKSSAVKGVIKFKDTGLKKSETYKYVVYSAMLSGFEASANIQFLDMPVDFTIQNTNKSITLTWEKIAGATTYRVYRKVRGDKYYKLVGDGKAYTTYKADGKKITRFKFIDTKVESGVTYLYTVKAVDGKHYSAYIDKDIINYNSITRLSTPKLTKIYNSKEGITFHWDPVEGAEGYYVYRKTQKGWVHIGTVNDPKSTAYLARDDQKYGVVDGIQNIYTVRAYNGKSRSSFDADGIKLLRLKQPTLEKAKSARNGVYVTWEGVKAAKGYYIYQKTPGGSWKRVGEVNSKKNYFVDGTAKKGKTYVYTVKAFSGKVTSSYNKDGLTVKDIY